MTEPRPDPATACDRRIHRCRSATADEHRRVVRLAGYAETAAALRVADAACSTPSCHDTRRPSTTTWEAGRARQCPMSRVGRARERAVMGPARIAAAAWELRRRRGKPQARRAYALTAGQARPPKGKRKCAKCQGATYERSSKRAYAERRAAGVCTRCGGKRDSEYLECDGCRERQRLQRASARLHRAYVAKTSRDVACAKGTVPAPDGLTWGIIANALDFRSARHFSGNRQQMVAAFR